VPYNLQGEWSIWDTDTQDIALDPINDNWREPPQAPPSYDFQGHDTPSSVFTNTNAHTESHTTWIPERKELRLYIVAGVMGQLISAMDLKTELGRARSEHGQVNVISLVFKDGDYKARSTESANLRGWLSRNGFRKIDSYNGHGVLVEKDLTAQKVESPRPKPRSEPKPLTPTEQAQRYRDAGLNIPPYLQRDLILEQEKQTAIENDPYRKRDELQKRIAELTALQARQDAQA
jgi:hypothetical protein